VLAFAGSRTLDLMALSIRLAGFEIRDSVAWLYGSGFPKSLDVSKAIDKGQGQIRDRQLQFTAWMRSTGITIEQINDATGTSMASHYLTDKSQPAIATADLFDKLRHLLPGVPEEIERLVAERTGIEWADYKNREVVGSQIQGKLAVAPGQDNDRSAIELDITAPATVEAQKWRGWGTALKPAFEPVVVARKPLIGTVAENVLLHGTGGLNIDGTRIGTGTGETKTVSYPDISGGNYGQDSEAYSDRKNITREVKDQGRWPSNVMLDEFTAGLVDEQSGLSKSAQESHSHENRSEGYNYASKFVQGYGDTGGASRFFYVAKASKRDRNEGLDELPGKHVGTYAQDEWSRNNMGGKPDAERKAVANFHPTVKPTDLMRQLVRLVTPSGGVVLDPFTGSGSTGKAAILEGFEFIGVELTDEYLPIIEGRLSHAVTQRAQAESDAVAAEAETLF
jgi:hypothetical protein